jgi:hypothetical protein
MVEYVRVPRPVLLLYTRRSNRAEFYDALLKTQVAGDAIALRQLPIPEKAWRAQLSRFAQRRGLTARIHKAADGRWLMWLDTPPPPLVFDA